MADPHWTSYVGMATGIIGAITGVSGAIMGFISYRKNAQNKTLDMRIELKKAVANINSDFKILLEQMVDGDKSRMRVSSALGMLNSGNTVRWKQELEADQATAKEIEQELLSESSDYDNLDTKGLEEKLIETHKIHQKITKLSKKYSEAMAWDDEQRKNIQANIKR